MKAKLPILWNHDHTKPIGSVEAVDGALKFKFSEDVKITREKMFEIFGGAGIRVTEMEEIDGVVTIKSGEILEFSFLALPP
jgi:hypothetical protein